MIRPSSRFDAVVFDLDGVVTRTETVHAAAWKALFDEFLAARGNALGDDLGTFDVELDYRRYVDGKPRYKGVRSFLASRGLELPEGEPGDPEDAETVCGLGNRKNRYFLERLAADGVEVYPATVDALKAVRELGVATALVSSSKNADAVLAAAGLTDLFDTRLDGVLAEKLGLMGKPAPDTFLEAARRIGVEPRRAVVVEDAIAGVQAARRGGFGRVVALDRARQTAALRAAGADVVLLDLSVDELLELHEAERAHLPRRPPPAPPPFRAAEGHRRWALAYEGWLPQQQGTREALLTLGNGYFATRGALAEAHADGVNYPGTYLAGGYSRFTARLADRTLEGEDLVNFPNWLWVGVSTAGEVLDLGVVNMLAHRQELDLRHGVLTRMTRWRDGAGRTTSLTERRIVSLASPHLCALETSIVAEDWSGALELTSGLDGTVTNAGVSPAHGVQVRHLEQRGNGVDAPDVIWLKVEARQSEQRVAMAARNQLFTGGRRVEAEPDLVEEEGRVAQRFRVPVEPGQAVSLEKVVAVYTSRDRGISEAALEARAAASRADPVAGLLRAHGVAWSQLWGRFDVQLDQRAPDAARPAEMLLRLHTFHLVQTHSPHSIDLDTGVPARGWTGEAYQGHVFWDELFVFPFFNLRLPEISRALLEYRHRRLGEARARARSAGLAGALYPWQSGSNGREETPAFHYNPILERWFPELTMLQRHVSAAIAYNVWQYWQATLDTEFLSYRGAEMFLEIARMWATSASYDDDHGRYSIRGVMGPDEFHDRYPGADRPGIDNNAYTNVMAAWVLWRVPDVLAALPADRRRELRDSLALDDDELERWEDISRRLRVCFLPDGIISQFEGWERLPELDLDAFARDHGGLFRINQVLEAEGRSPGSFRISKQADVLMLFFLFSSGELKDIFTRLGYPFDERDIPRTIDYYLRRTTHGSTLSRVAHSWVLARVDRARSWNLFVEALHSDVSDIQGGTTREGIHLGAMAGSLDLVQRCYTGLETRDGVLWLSPRLPEELEGVQLHLHYRGQSLTLQVEPGRALVRATESSAAPVRVGVHSRVYTLMPGESVQLTFRRSRREDRRAAAGS